MRPPSLPLLVLLAASACHAGGGDDYPITPNGDDGTVIPGSDAAVADGTTGDGNTLNGRVCLLADLRQPAVCQDTGAEGLTVTLGTATATTVANGGFSIATPLATNLVWHVTGATLTPSVMPYSPVALIPAVTTARYQNLTISNGVIVNAGEGSVVTSAFHAGVAVAGATTTVVPDSTFTTYYDGTSATIWDQGHTGAFGTSWIPGIAVGAATVTTVASIAGSASSEAATVPIEDGAITFVVLELP